MKKICVVAILLFFSIINLNAQNQWIEDQEMNFKISIPANYQTNQLRDGTDKIHAFVSPDQNIAVRVRCLQVPANTTVDVIKQVFSKNIINGSKELISEAYTLNGMTGTMAGYRWKFNGIKVIVGAFYTIQNGIAYIVWSLVPENLVSQRNAEADAITNSFSLLNGGSAVASTQSSGGLGGLGGLGGGQATSQAPAQSSSSSSSNITIMGLLVGTAATADNQVMNPSTVFEPTANTLHVGFEYNGNAKGKTIITKLYNQTTGAFIKEIPFFAPNAPSGFGNARLDAPGGIWQEGQYRIEIWLNNQKLTESWIDIISTNSVNTSAPVTNTAPSIPSGYFSIVSDDACIEFIAPNGYQVESSEVGQTIWNGGSGIKLVQQTIIKQSDFETFIADQVSSIQNHGAKITKKEFSNINGLKVCQYFYEYSNSLFAYVSAENNNVFLLLGYVGNMNLQNTITEYSNTTLKNLLKSNCQY